MYPSLRPRAARRAAGPKVLHGNWETTTFVAALRYDCVKAPFVLEGAMNGETFRAYVEQFLAPTLKSRDIVFMDNVPIPQVRWRARMTIERRGAISCLSPGIQSRFQPH